jgi:hypothetical protein
VTIVFPEQSSEHPLNIPKEWRHEAHPPSQINSSAIAINCLRKDIDIFTHSAKNVFE